MIHYSCDRCRRVLGSDELRYVVRLEASAAMDAADGEDEDDRDHLLEIHEILERLDDEQSDEIGEDVYVRRRYDVCADCYRRFAADPLGREATVAVRFSEN